MAPAPARPRPDTDIKKIHDRLRVDRGPARKYACVGDGCSRPALDWAFQPGGEENLDPLSGRPFSTRQEDYAPMCRSCHVLLDAALGVARGFAVAPPSTFSVESKAKATAAAIQNAVKAREAYAENLADPVERERIRTSHRRGAAKANQMRRKCSACGLVKAPGPLGRHQQVSGHYGWETA